MNNKQFFWGNRGRGGGEGKLRCKINVAPFGSSFTLSSFLFSLPPPLPPRINRRAPRSKSRSYRTRPSRGEELRSIFHARARHLLFTIAYIGFRSIDLIASRIAETRVIFGARISFRSASASEFIPCACRAYARARACAQVSRERTRASCFAVCCKYLLGSARLSASPVPRARSAGRHFKIRTSSPPGSGGKGVGQMFFNRIFLEIDPNFRCSLSR